MSVCELSRDYGAYRNRLVAVRGVYYYGLREDCHRECAVGPWPSFIDLTSMRGADAFAGWRALDEAGRRAEAEAKKGKRLEVWVTAVGRLKTYAHRSPLGPCDRQGTGLYGYGNGIFPAQLVVKHFRDIDIKANPESPYDYSKLYRGVP